MNNQHNLHNQHMYMHIVNDYMEGDNSVQRGVSLTSSNSQWTNLQPSQSKVSSKSHIKYLLSLF